MAKASAAKANPVTAAPTAPTLRERQKFAAHVAAFVRAGHDRATATAQVAEMAARGPLDWPRKAGAPAPVKAVKLAVVPALAVGQGKAVKVISARIATDWAAGHKGVCLSCGLRNSHVDVDEVGIECTHCGKHTVSGVRVAVANGQITIR